MRYGTLLCDLEQHRPIDLLDDREPETFAAWLREHPEVEVITRDRAHCFAEGAKLGAPQAMQVADRFHLMQNLREALVRMLDRCQGQMALAMRDAVSSRDPPEQPTTQAPATTARTTGIPRAPTHREVRRDRRIARYDKVMDMHIQGISQRSIARQLKMNRATVGRYIHAGQFPERAARRYESKADRFIDYLQQRWGEGCHSAAQLTRELKRLGFKGSYCSVKRRVARWEKCSDAPSARSMDKQAPSAKRTAWMILKSPDGLNEDERGFLSALEHRCPDIALAVQLAGEFVSMVHREGNSTLQTWIPCAQDKAVPMALRHFATGLKADYRAVEAGLTTEWSNGQLEGQVNRLKLIKRQMYGRAKFDLLRQRVLHAN
jgi:transposase